MSENNPASTAASLCGHQTSSDCFPQQSLSILKPQVSRQWICLPGTQPALTVGLRLWYARKGGKMQPEVKATAWPTSKNNPRTTELETDLRSELEARIGAKNYHHWFRDKTTFEIDGEVLTIGVGSPFLLNWVQRQFRLPLSEAARTRLGESATVQIRVDPHVLMTDSNKSSESQASQLSAAETEDIPAGGRPATGSAAGNDSKRAPSKQPLGRRRFADLTEMVVGPGNDMAVLAARQVVEEPHGHFNPLLVYGGVGLGKTHLLEGIYRLLRREYPTLNVTYLTAETFANYFTEALQKHTLPAFRTRFRGIDVLLVDDVDFLDGKRVIQEEFLNTLKELEHQQKQVVLTSDRHPRLFAKSSDELVSRFLAGLTCRIEAPDLETRQKILQSRAARWDGQFAPEALQYVAQRFSHNVRELIGALNCLHAYYRMTQKRVTGTAARQVLSELERDCVRVVRMSDVSRVVCERFGVEPEDLKSEKRSRTISQPRMLAMYLSRRLTQAAFSEIGSYFGGRNHSTVMSATKRVEDWLQQGEQIRIASHNWSVQDLVAVLEQELLAG